MSAVVDTPNVTLERPQRADARRNFDALLRAARDAFNTQGITASLEDIARQAGVGIGTLYRHFPTREALIEAVYVESVDEVVQASREFDGLPPWEAFSGWLWRFVDYSATKRVLIASLNRESDAMRRCRDVFFAAGQPLLARAQKAGEVSAEAQIDDIIRLIVGVAGVVFPDAASRERVLGLAINGLRTTR